MYKTALALILAIPLLGASPQISNADVDFRIYLGVPHYTYQVAPDYRYRKAYGWYRPSWNRFSCNEAARIVRNNGYRNIAVRECSGRTYTFSATKSGRRMQVFVNSHSGVVWRG